MDNSVLDERSTRVDQQAKPSIGQPQVGEQLLSVNRRQALYRLDLDDHLILDNQISAKPDVKPNGPVDYWYCLLVHRSESTLSQFIGKHGMVEFRTDSQPGILVIPAREWYGFERRRPRSVWR